METAKHNLIWYMRRVWTEAGLKWDTDNDAEIVCIFDDIEKAIDAKIAAALKGGEQDA